MMMAMLPWPAAGYGDQRSCLLVRDPVCSGNKCQRQVGREGESERESAGVTLPSLHLNKISFKI